MQTGASHLPLTIERMTVGEWIWLRTVPLSALVAGPPRPTRVWKLAPRVPHPFMHRKLLPLSNDASDR